MKTLIIFNPSSGNKNPENTKSEVLAYLHQNNFDVDFFETDIKEQSHKMIKAGIKNGVQRVIAMGGDGTINTVINSIAGKDIVMGIIPTGTGNLLASALGIPSDIKTATEIAFTGQQRRIDLGKIKHHYFSIIAGCGFDADIMQSTTRDHKKVFGYLAYFLEGVKHAIVPKKSIYKLTIDGTKIKKRAVNVLIINTANIFGDLITVVPSAQIDDGLLDVCIFSPNNTMDYIPVLWHILTKQSFDNPVDIKGQSILHFKAKHIYLDCKPKRFIQADGDILDKPPVSIEIKPKFLPIMVPSSADMYLSPEARFFNLMKKYLEDLDRVNLI